MESRRKRKRSQITKWVCYALLMLLCTVLQTLPGLFRLGEAKAPSRLAARWRWPSRWRRASSRGASSVPSAA